MFLTLVVGFFAGGTLISWWRSRRGHRRHYPDTRELGIRQGEAVSRHRPSQQGGDALF